MIRKPRTERDSQQWMLDLALNMRGRVQNFEMDGTELPPGQASAQLSHGPQAVARGGATARTAREARTDQRPQRDGDLSL